MEGTALELDEMPLTQDDSGGNKDPTSGEERGSRLFIHRQWEPSHSPHTGTSSVDALESFFFQGSGC